MGNRFTTTRRHDGESAPGLDLSRVIVIGFLIAAALGLMTAGGSSPAEAQSGARIHLIHGIPDTPVDVVAGGEVVFSDFRFQDTQDLSALAGQTLAGLQVRLAGTDTVAIDAEDGVTQAGLRDVVADALAGADVEVVTGETLVHETQDAAASTFTYLKHLYYRYCVECEAQHPDAARAVVEGLSDALAGRYGPRQERLRPGAAGIGLLFDGLRTGRARLSHLRRIAPHRNRATRAEPR